ncbi:hypothetical protein EUGRSUZ_H02729 [Eucalyptus grandis]|uniref:Uncharacterized protein n=2 Tax=Eucalyptus grandis TaxID=71139 RepID=A0ACC3JSF7_EUCGR|nr:hypothetical protein EUGRSUZ_H02729 [Eucalyptus grandis]
MQCTPTSHHMKKMKPSHFYLHIFMMDFSGRYNQKEKPRFLTKLGHNSKEISTPYIDHVSSSIYKCRLSSKSVSSPLLKQAITSTMVRQAVAAVTSPASLHHGGRGPTRTPR